MYKNRKLLILGVLCFLVVVMAVGFALLSQELNISGTYHIDSNWNIRITNIRVKSLNSAYSTGDKIENYKGSDWYVIKNPGSNDDYVTLMKETKLTATELGTYASSIKCNFPGDFDGQCTNSTDYYTTNSLPYYWSSTCHAVGTFGTDTYDSRDESGCSGHNDYAGSKIKEAVEAYATSKGMMSELAEVDGYKIRLITRDELNTNLGWSALDKYATDNDNSNVPSWVYGTTYWTMTPHPDNAYVWRVGGDPGTLVGFSIIRDSGVRPVINLLKSAIPSGS